MPQTASDASSCHLEHADSEPVPALGAAAHGFLPSEQTPSCEAPDELRDVDLAALLQRCARGDRDAFDQLYRLTSRRLSVLAERVLAQSQGAEEAMQESYLKIWRRAGQFDARRGAPMTWMINIVRHQALDMLRRPEHRIRRAEPIGEEPEEHWPASPWRDPASELHIQRALAQVYGAVSTKDCIRQRCLELVYKRGYSLSEAAHALGLPVSTAKTWAARSVAKAKVRFRAAG